MARSPSLAAGLVVADRGRVREVERLQQRRQPVAHRALARVDGRGHRG
jgi:hypothetical protein